MECDNVTTAESRLAALLYEGAHLTILDSYATLLRFSIRHGLSKKALSELIQLVNLHLPHSSQSVRSVYKLNKLFTDTFDDVQTKSYNYCSSCHALLDADKCSNTLCDEAPVCKFIMFPLATQLKRRLEGNSVTIVGHQGSYIVYTLTLPFMLDPQIWMQLQKRYSRSTDGGLHDIYDGADSVKYTRPGGFLSADHPANVSLTINTDGVQVFKSSDVHFWPVWLVVNELPPTFRYRVD